MLPSANDQIHARAAQLTVRGIIARVQADWHHRTAHGMTYGTSSQPSRVYLHGDFSRYYCCTQTVLQVCVVCMSSAVLVCRANYRTAIRLMSLVSSQSVLLTKWTSSPNHTVMKRQVLLRHSKKKSVPKPSLHTHPTTVLARTRDLACD